MDGVSVASGIAGLITLALQVSGTIAAYVIAIKDKSKNIEELHQELILLCTVLGQFRTFLQDEKLRGRPFDSDPDSVLQRCVKDCYARIERIGDRLQPSRVKTVARALERMKWPFEQNEILRMIENLRRYIQIFQFAINIENCVILSKTSEVAETNLRQVRDVSQKVAELQLQVGLSADEATKQAGQVGQIIDSLSMLEEATTEIKEISQTVRLAELRERDRRTTDILEWLSPLSSLSKHKDVQAKRVEGTGRWLFENHEVANWMSASQGHQHVLCVAGPGAGKSVAASLLIDHLREQYADADAAVAYYYADYTEQQTQTPAHFASTLLRQLCSKLEDIPVFVAEFYQKTRNEIKDQAWFADLQSVFHRVIRTFSVCFFVIDALDELPVSQRAKLLEVLRLTSENVAGASSVRIFATSRPHAVIQAFSFKVLRISANENDLRFFISKKIDEYPDSEYIMDAALKKEITEKLCENAQGMFLLPALQIEDILSQDTKADVRRKLNNPPANLDELYSSTIERIKSQRDSRRETAIKTLMWLSHVKQPLTVAQLQHALAIRLDDENADLDRENILSPKIILDSCFGLVSIEADSQIFKFHHFSVEEYLRSSRNHGLFEDDECDLMIGRVCLIYMSLASLKALPFINRKDFAAALGNLPFLEYASSQWGHHVRHVKVDLIKDLALPFLNNSLNLLAVSRVQGSQSAAIQEWRQRMFTWAFSGGAGIWLAAGYGTDDLIRLLFDENKQNLSARDMYGNTALHQAARYGFGTTVELLIAYGMNVMDQNASKNTPLYMAVAFNQPDIVQILLKHGKFQLDVSGAAGWTPLHKAADSGSVAMTTLLLQSGALPASQDDKLMSPLHLAARKGNFEVVKLLLLAGALIEARDIDRLTALDLAASSGHTETVKCLIDNEASISHKGFDFWTPLHRASRGGHLNLAMLLLEKGATVLDADYKGNIPLFLAVRSGNLDLVNLLLESRPSTRRDQVLHKDRKGATARAVAFYTAHYDIHKFLRAAEKEYIVGVPSSASNLTEAIEEKSVTKVLNLVKSSPSSIDTPDDEGQPPLHVAIQEQSAEITMLLLNHGASIESLGYHGWRPIHVAASLGNLELVDICLAHGANLHSLTATSQTALHKACSSSSIAVVRRLLDTGTDIAATNSRGMTALHIAAHQNQRELAKCLILEYEADVFARDSSGDTPSRWAERIGHLEMTAILRAEGKKRRAEGNVEIPNLKGKGRSLRKEKEKGSGKADRLDADGWSNLKKRKREKKEKKEKHGWEDTSNTQNLAPVIPGLGEGGSPSTSTNKANMGRKLSAASLKNKTRIENFVFEHDAEEDSEIEIESALAFLQL